MSITKTITRLTLIVNHLRRYRFANYDQLSDCLVKESSIIGYDLSISVRTMQRDFSQIRELFHIDIQYSNSHQAYYINELDDDIISERRLEAYDLFTALKLGERLSPYIYPEPKGAKGSEFIFDLLRAIEKRQIINIRYSPFWSNEGLIYTVRPYALKEFKYRWYLIAHDNKNDTIKSFALDRFTELEIINEIFIYPERYDVNREYKYCFGIIGLNGNQPEKIVLSFTVQQGKYIASLPLHASQKTLVDTNSEYRIELTLVPTEDFIMEILSFGDKVKVIEPSSLKEQVKQIYQYSLTKYDDE